LKGINAPIKADLKLPRKRGNLSFRMHKSHLVIYARQATMLKSTIVMKCVKQTTALHLP